MKKFKISKLILDFIIFLIGIIIGDIINNYLGIANKPFCSWQTALGIFIIACLCTLLEFIFARIKEKLLKIRQ
ncbi:hypothetical protein [Inconstantimicrobium mannanitabidum]|uniref:Uncharacterized protein n=1 Tax=Inconstantimicrobium mannanitabidum TaxID=1604901 RepID=A0ACB5RBR0_9CLOT|nr:hypothetical protein [Clostridium sp. TW13]GKX66674.1 hypothetical protein rsdtw13_19320 [Clostridium sp. TW13]